MPDWLTAALLGAVQGATEFLPVSSSGHLLAFERVTAYKVALAFDALLHFPTLLAVLIYFRRELWRIATSPERGPILLRLVLGTVPAGLIALAFHSFREGIAPWFLVLGWTLSGAYLLLSAGREGPLGYSRFPLWKTTLVGGAQGIAAVIPGFSRSGASIASGLWLDLERREALRFSFLLSIPLTMAAIVWEGRKVFHSGGLDVPGGWPALAGALIAAFLVGLCAIHILFRAVAGNHFHRFGWYNLLAAAAFAIYLLTR